MSFVRSASQQESREYPQASAEEANIGANMRDDHQPSRGRVADDALNNGALDDNVDIDILVQDTAPQSSRASLTRTSPGTVSSEQLSLSTTKAIERNAPEHVAQISNARLSEGHMEVRQKMLRPSGLEGVSGDDVIRNKSSNGDEPGVGDRETVHQDWDDTGDDGGGGGGAWSSWLPSGD